VIDDAVRRILGVKMWLGLFEHPYVTEEQMNRYEELPEEHTALAQEAAEKSIVLLKNEGNLLPLDKHTKIALAGTLADSREEIIGAWAMNWRLKDCVTILEGMKGVFPELEYFPCGGPEGELREEEIHDAAAYGDVIVAILGETIAMSGEASSRSDITLPGRQRELLQRLLDTGKPVVLVLMNGRPLALSWEQEHLPAIVEAWHLGIRMGDAVAAVLAGDRNPEGRLSASFPRATGQCPVYYNHPNTGRPGSKSKFTSRYLDIEPGVLYPFGYGLSYTTFEYSDFVIDETEDELHIIVRISNTGDRAGRETVQLYTQDPAASLVRSVKELKRFRKVELEPGDQEEVTFTLLKTELGFYDNEGIYQLEDGMFRIYVGGNSRDCLMKEIFLTK